MRGTIIGRRARLGLFVAILAVVWLAAARNAAANTPIVVNRDDDAHDVNPGDGACETFPGSGLCTLRAAIEEAEALPGADTITFDPDLPNPTTIVLSLGHILISTDLTITGRGSSMTIIDGDGSVTNDRVFNLTNAASTFTVTISGVSIQNGNANGLDGGGIAFFSLGSHLSLSDVLLANNVALAGGGIALTGAVTLDHCTVSGNSATLLGGGIWSNGPIIVTSSTIVGNSAPRGGGLYNDSGVRLVGSTVTGNTATIDGGGLYDGAGSLDVTNTTITGNHSSQHGAGIFVKPGPIFLRTANATITNNFCNITFTGCGIYVDAGASGTITNTILAQNYQRSKVGNVADDCNALTSGDFNLIQTTAGCTISGAPSNDIYGTDPNVGPLQDNGGPTQTIALLAGSPAIDAGRPSPSGCNGSLGGFLSTDQRGSVRPVNGRCDMGAFEYAPPAQFYSLPPCRLVDTRSTDGPALTAGTDRGFTLVGKCLVPAEARALSLNVTVAAGTSLGDLRIFPAGTTLPPVSAINFAKGQTRANNAITSLSGSGVLAIHDDQAAGNSVQVILDVNGYFR